MHDIRKILKYSIDELEPYINWLYFYHAWGLSGKPAEEKLKLRGEAESLLAQWKGKCFSHAVFLITDANSDGDDIVVGNTRLPMLRQQQPRTPGGYCLSLADFIRPLSQGVPDRIGMFAVTVDRNFPAHYADDPYLRMMAQVLCDRLAEGTAELMHLQVRRTYWGYAPDEHLTMSELHQELYQGIRPAVGYPSMPDTSMNFLLDSLLHFSDIGISLTDTGMMKPHASVSGLMIAHPKSRYFELGKIGPDQLADYARRRGLSVDTMRRFLASSLRE